jgi:hypothetical protein
MPWLAAKPQFCSDFEPPARLTGRLWDPHWAFFRLALREGREHRLTLSFGLTPSGSRAGG